VIKKVYCDECVHRAGDKVTCGKRIFHPVLGNICDKEDCRIKNKHNDCIDYKEKVKNENN